MHYWQIRKWDLIGFSLNSQQDGFEPEIGRPLFENGVVVEYV